MFVKIKLEPQSSRALSSLKNISYFSIDDDATIITLKMKIEEYVDVPAERQEIRTLTKTFQNNWLVKEVCDVKGSSVMLYAYEEFYEYQDPHFVCFLQVYTNEMAAQQQEMEQRLKSISSSAATVIAVSDTDDSEGTDSETASSKSSGTDSESSGSSTDNTDTSGGKKRSKHVKQSTHHKKLKVAASVGGQYSPTLCQYLDEFPKSHKEITTESDPVKKSPPANNSKTVEVNPCKSPTTIKSTINKKSSETIQQNTTTTTTNCSLSEKNTNSCGETSSSSLNKIQSNIISTSNNNIHPCYAINPEIREYVGIISKTDMSDINRPQCEELLVWFFDRFRACDSSNKLQFDKQTAVTLYEGKLWIACMDENTLEWISASISECNLTAYTILSLKETSHHLCEVVVPIVSNSKKMLDIFDLLEKQNKNLSTLKWCITSRKILLPEEKGFNEKAISTFCTNEIFQIVMDEESKNYLENFNLKLKYCFWQIVFKFVNT